MNKENLKTNKTGYPKTPASKVFFVLGITVLVVAVIAVVFSIKYDLIKVDIPLVDKASETVVQEALNGKSYLDVKDIYQNDLTGPNISSTSKKADFLEQLGETQNSHSVVFVGEEFVLSKITIKQGDIVVWENPTNKRITIKGDGWKSLISLEPGSRYAQEFDFIGEYPYEVEENNKIKGLIIVEKRTQ